MKTTVKTTTKKSVAAKPAAKVTKTKAVAKPKSLYYFDMTPAGRMLRAYFVAFITAQTGKLVADTPFKLWPAANVRGHLDTKKLARKDGMYALTSAGVNYFTDPTQAADKDMVDGMLKAITTGEKPAFYKHNLQAIS